MEEEEEVAMRMTANIARNRRTEVRRRNTRAPTDDASVQTDTDTPDADWLTESFMRMRKQTTVLCYMGFALVISNITQLRCTLSAGDQHKHYVIILALLAVSLIIQCSIALVLLYVSKKEAEKTEMEGYPLTQRTCNMMVALITVVSFINMTVTVIA